MARAKSMDELLEIVRRLRKQESIRAIRKETGLHRTVIRKVRDIAAEKGWMDVSHPLPAEEEMKAAYSGAEDSSFKTHSLDACREEIKDYLQKEYSFVVIHRLCSEKIPCSEPTLRRYIHKRFPVETKAVMMRIPEDAVMEVDYGYLGIVYDPLERRSRKAWVFSGRLRKSRKAYREVVYNQRAETFFKCHVHAFHCFGGVPKKVVPDNLKAAVVKAALYDPVINHSYRELAAYYGFLISPCLPRKPEHKGGVENDVKYVKRNFWPYFVEKQKQKGHEVPFSTEVEDALQKWDEEISNVRVIKGVGTSPERLFSEESKTLLPLPEKEWDMITWKKCKVRPEWLIQFDNAYYSVPYRFIGKEVIVYADTASVKIFFDLSLIAFHERAQRKWEYKRNPLHAPVHQEEYLNTTKESILNWAGHIGKSTLEVIEKILSDNSVDNLRPARGVLSFAKKYSVSRLEAACRRAIDYDIASYKAIKNILLHKLDNCAPEELPAIRASPESFRFARGKDYYKIQENKL